MNLLTPLFTFAVLEPKGLIASNERNLIITAVLLMLVVVVPVFAMVIMVARKYRAGNRVAKYTPDWDQNSKIQVAIWGILCTIIVILGVINWQSTHTLDPSKPISSTNPPMTIQVVALQWKWLFIYPAENIATLNFVQFPQATPINFELTADAPMNSFWIPQLGGQMYAMPGMTTHLHLMAEAPGEFAGSAAEISGKGFAGMKFMARASSQSDFDTWVQSIQQIQDPAQYNMLTELSLTMPEYNQLAKPSENNPVAYYSSVQSDLFHQVIMKFMPVVKVPMSDMEGMEMMDMEGMP